MDSIRFEGGWGSGSMTTRLPFNIYQYSSHLEFLQDAYAYFHSEDETFSYDRIAELCGLKSRTEARNLLKGQKKASDAQLAAFARIFALGESEAKYLVCLSRFAEAGGNPAAFELFQKLIALQKENSPAAAPFRDVEVATSVLHMTLLSVLDLSDAPRSAEEITAKLKNRYPQADVAAALVDLENCGYATRDSEGRLVVSQKHIKKYDYNSNFFLKRFHQQSLAIAKDALENEATSERYLVGASFCINGKVFPRIVQKMNAFVENLMQLEGVAGDADTVVQFNQQLIKMSAGGTAEVGPGLRRESAERAFAENQNEGIVRANSAG